jgi:exodeoxyribonuclease VII large subunit
VFAASGTNQQYIHQNSSLPFADFSHLMAGNQSETEAMSTEWPYNPETGEIIEQPKPNIGEYSVTEISHALKKTLEDAFGHVRVRGEISGYRGPHSSGHCYFSIKDEGAKLDAVIWRGNFSRLRAKMQEGLEVVATGKITSYPGKSNYQIVIENIEPAGVGALMALLEERKRKLAAEGLFDAERKKALPYLPQLIGVVTSPTGAVIRDILHRLSDRFPRHVLVWPVRVQGETSAAEVAAAIRGFNAMANPPDLLIVARGGGSLEDLWGFNEEIVIRAVAESRIPVISAVGHETDTTLIDLVSDHRAPTPTAAAERAVPVRAELLAELASLHARQARGIARYFDERRTRLRAAGRALPKPDEILALVRQRFDSLATRLPPSLKVNVERHRLALVKTSSRLTLEPIRQRQREQARRLNEIGLRHARAISVRVQGLKDRLSAEAKLFAALNYTSVLARGFALVRDAKDQPVKNAASVSPGQSLKIQFSDDTLTVTAVGKTAQGELF